MHLLDAPLAIVDLETTGTDPANDRVTEIAVLEVDGFDSGAVRAEWSTLVNPGTGIPSPIQALTGITNEMVAAAPRFAEVAEALFERLGGRIFVAHNARFDYGFLRREFDRAGIRFTAKTLCTVRLSRRLYPGERAPQPRQPDRAPRHRLPPAPSRDGRRRSAVAVPARSPSASTARRCSPSPRARSRASRRCRRSSSARRSTRFPRRRASTSSTTRATGPLYIGKSASMRTRVLSHFSGTTLGASVELARECGASTGSAPPGELGALLLEARLVKELAPEFNRQLRAAEGLCGFAFDGRRLRFAGAHEIDGDTLPFVYGVFRSKRAAMQALRSLADEHRLCLQALGFESGPQHACFRHQLGRCAGVCAGRGERAPAPCAPRGGARRLEGGGLAARGAARHRRERQRRAKRRKCTSSTAGATSARRAPTPRWPSSSKAGAAGVSTSTTTASSRATSASAACAPSASPRRALRADRPGAAAASRERGSLPCARAAACARPSRNPRVADSGAVAARRFRPARRPARRRRAGPRFGRGSDPGDAWWVRADPVHLRVLRDRVVVVPGEALQVAPEEADELAVALNRHFA